MSFGYFNSPIGKIKIEGENEYITGVHFLSEKETKTDNIHENEELSEEIIKCKRQLEEYFNGNRSEFYLNLKFLRGTEFQQNVWKELMNIPYGETRSYKEMAEKINNPKACRAIGGANNKNPIGIIIPCHRVIGAKGQMVGYAEGVDKKKFLLDLEMKNK